MKKIILALCLILALAACQGRQTTETVQPETSPPKPSSRTPKPNPRTLNSRSPPRLRQRSGIV